MIVHENSYATSKFTIDFRSNMDVDCKGPTLMSSCKSIDCTLNNMLISDEYVCKKIKEEKFCKTHP